MNPDLIADTSTNPIRSRRKRRKGVAPFILSGAALLVVVATVAAIAHLSSLWVSFDTKTGKIPSAFPQESTRPTSIPAENGKTPINLLLVGSDSRSQEKDQGQGGQSSDQRSDTIMLVHIPADRKQAYVVSIMRDTWITIPGHRDAKINAALAYGGVPLMVQTVESLMSQRIDHVVFVDFEGFQGLTDAVGGVDVNVPVPFVSTMAENPGLRFNQGLAHMDGKTAFAFIHERYAFRDGDYQRVRNQQLYVKALLGKLIKPATLANPATTGSIVNDFSPFLRVDETLTSGTVVSLALELKDIRTEDVIMFTLPTKGTGRSEDGQSIVLLDAGSTEQLSNSMTRGTVSQFIDEKNIRKGN